MDVEDRELIKGDFQKPPYMHPVMYLVMSAAMICR